MNIEKINLQQSRDFGETFNVSVKLLRQNFKLFFQCMLLLAGPFILLSAISGAFYQASALSVSPVAMSNPMNILQKFGITYFIFIATTILANLAMLGT
ncbi:MAG: hypothetical protein H0X46_06305, partial [Bacteroidetes bacterium]|nr:hypothetical protein [Bacteroidota bacterium]